MQEKDTYLKNIKESKQKWKESIVEKSKQRLGTQDDPIMYTPADLEDFDFAKDVGFPGEFPFTAGRVAIPLVPLMWGKGKINGAGKMIKGAFGYSGCGTAKDLRDFYMDKGAHLAARGPNIAFDLPTQCGLDSDHPQSEGEVGKVGLAIDSLKDFETLYEVFTGPKEIDKIASNWTINGTTNIVLAMYAALAEKRGIPVSSLRGTPQNDILKEFVARGTQVFPVKPSMRMTRDTITYCTEHMPKMNTISISGFHMKEAGATRIQAIAFTMANGLAYLQSGVDAGLDIDKFIGKTTFLSFGGGMKVLKELASRRAARKVWAILMRDKMGVKNPKFWIYKESGGALAGYWTSTKQRPLNNWFRVGIGAAFSALIGDPPVLQPPFDEPLGLGHSKEAQQLGADASRILVEECELCEVQDVFAGSYYIESLTKQYVKEIFEQLDAIDELGGPIKAVESGWMKSEIAKSAAEYEKKMATGEEIRVGINKYTEEDEIEIIPKLTPMYASIDREAAEKKQLANLKKLKEERDNTKVKASLEKIENAAADEKANLIPFFIDAVKEYTTMGEICGTLKNVFGSAL